MRVLIDTHVMLWTLDRTDLVGKAAFDILASPDTRRVVSVVSLWEVAIKRRLGKLSAPDDLPAFLAEGDDDGETAADPEEPQPFAEAAE